MSKINSKKINRYCKEYYIEPCYYNPNKQSELILILKKLLTEVEDRFFTVDKAEVALRILEWNSKNIWLLKNNERYGNVIKFKIIEFQNIDAICVKNYEWMLDINLDPSVVYTKSGRKIKKPVLYE